MNSRPLWYASAMIALLTLSSVGATPPSMGSGHYTGEGVVILVAALLDGTQPVIAENGAVVCQDTDGNDVPDHGLGGACIPFDDLAGDSVLVTDFDAAIGTDVVFQVCVDVDGDSRCGGPNANANGCNDIIFFSHRTTDGANFNPLFVEPVFSKFQFQSCNSAGFAGYVVITCAGAHVNGGGLGTHTHHATQGLATGAVTGGTPQGDFCGSLVALKAYTVV